MSSWLAQLLCQGYVAVVVMMWEVCVHSGTFNLFTATSIRKSSHTPWISFTLHSVRKASTRRKLRQAFLVCLADFGAGKIRRC